MCLQFEAACNSSTGKVWFKKIHARESRETVPTFNHILQIQYLVDNAPTCNLFFHLKSKCIKKETGNARHRRNNNPAYVTMANKIEKSV